MSDVKRKPANALPWAIKHGTHVKAGPYDHSVAVAPLTSSTQGADADANAAYIAHTANAYPKLIEALRIAPVDGPHGDDCRCSCCDFQKARRALLVELGEAS